MEKKNPKHYYRTQSLWASPDALFSRWDNAVVEGWVTSREHTWFPNSAPWPVISSIFLEMDSWHWTLRQVLPTLNSPQSRGKEHGLQSFSFCALKWGEGHKGEGQKVSKAMIRHNQRSWRFIFYVFVHLFTHPGLSGLSLLLWSFYPGGISHKSSVDTCREVDKAGTGGLESEWAVVGTCDG